MSNRRREQTAVTYVLVHPTDEGFDEYQERWAEIRRREGTHIIPDGDYLGLRDTSYLEEVCERGRHTKEEIRIAGQMGTACVETHMNALLGDPLVQHGLVELSIDESAIVQPKGLRRTIEAARRQLGVRIKVVQTTA